MNFFSALKDKSNKLMVEFIKKGQNEGVIRKSLKPELIMYLADVMEHVMNSDRMKSIMPDPHERLDLMLNLTFYGIVDSNRHNGTER
jgi:hypothetical protein